MIKHSASHGFSVLICTIIAAFVVELLKPYLPGMIEMLSKVSVPVVETLNIPLQAEALNVVLLAAVLAVLWGAFFKLRFVR